MAYLKAAIAMTLGVYTSRSFVNCNLFQMGCFVVARFLLASTSQYSSAIAELLVYSCIRYWYYYGQCPKTRKSYI